MTGNEYANFIAEYIILNYAKRGIKIYREVSIGKSIIGKNRRVDVFAVCDSDTNALAIECKYQEVQGTADEKIPYTLQDMSALRMPACVAYAGSGFSLGVIHMLQASEMAAYCLPSKDSMKPTKDTRELDHLMALTFKWWDLLVQGKKPFRCEENMY